ncbi:DNA topoisomerase IB [Cereibacter sphaeroides]|uniref:DNA topoisomerase IB n=1 Tax=Cereibacter sphaeroides TaxID=1063 RepID=UPI001F15E946|nr:DNA topoisomerase IB [Cereibacter sphaeroides]MCE6952546.1 DNA topoisomerase IB [Cereibacter sphaeroides]
MKDDQVLIELPDGGEALVPRGLVYISDSEPGISRRRCGKGFVYRGPDGRLLSREERQRVQKLGIPPAYQRVWICPLDNGHLQATGFDARGRKQYRYHPDWGTWRAQAKYGLLAAFGRALPRLRRRVARDLRAEAGELAFSLAALTMLIDRTYLRVGTSTYAEENGSYGATTLLARHVKLRDGEVRLDFRAKGGKRVRQVLKDRRLHRILQEIEDLPGRNLFTWIDDEGQVRRVASQHVNDYLADATGLPGASAKTFRTWGGSLAAFGVARAAEGKLTVKMMAEAAAERLHNTPTISRTSYIHPRILGLADLRPDDRMALLADAPCADDPDLRSDERRMLGYLEQ